MRLKEKITENAEKLRSSAAGMTEKRLTFEIEKRFESLAKLTRAGKCGTDPEYKDTLSQLHILTDEIRDRLGSQKPLGRMKVRAK